MAAAQPILICLGATKAGTSWLYRALHDHPDCRLPAVKELHYFDTFDAEARARQVAAYRGRLAEYVAAREEAVAAARGWQADNMERRIGHMEALLGVLEGPREDDALYRHFLASVGAGRLTADMTPNYALAPGDALARLGALPSALFVYLVRDPLARLWSHVRMQATRQRQPGETVEKKANGILWRVLNKGHETHITARGDYAGAAARLSAALPSLRIEAIEEVAAPSGWARLCAWLGIAETRASAERVHEGPQVEMREDLRLPALRLLKDQYEWAARHWGEPPAAWRDNMARALA